MMDPNDCLKDMLALAKRYRECDDPQVARLCELVEAIDGWMSRGGFPPERWSSGKNL
jgi:hypothetical protein